MWKIGDSSTADSSCINFQITNIHTVYLVKSRLNCFIGQIKIIFIQRYTSNNMKINYKCWASQNSMIFHSKSQLFAQLNNEAAGKCDDSGLRQYSRSYGPFHLILPMKWPWTSHIIPAQLSVVQKRMLNLAITVENELLRLCIIKQPQSSHNNKNITIF